MFTRSRVLLIASVVALGGLLWVGSKSFAPPPAAADEFTVSGPFTHGNLTVFLLHGPDAERSRPVLGLDEALARQCAVVHETGDVNELTVENTSEEDDLLLLSGDIVKGGKQDRVLQATMILPPKSGKVPVRSFCVEQSRWTKRGSEDATRFAENRGVIAGNELKKAVQLAGSQGAVWANVQAQQAALSRNVGTMVNSAESPTSLQLALENDKLKAEVAKFREAITAKAGEPVGVVGFVTVVNGQVTGAEAFGSHTLFRKAWAKAVSAAAVEAVAAKENRTFTEMTTGGVRTFLARAGEEARESERGEGVGRDSNAGPVGSPDGFIVRQGGTMGISTATRDRLLQSGGGTNDVITEVNNLLETLDSSRELSMTTHPSPTPLNPSDPVRVNVVQGVPVRVRPRVLDSTASMGGTQNVVDSLAPQRNTLPPAKTAVVEYREKGNGAVIHKSFLPR